jgi:putative ABC transport system ATP-binding protein
MPSLDFIDIVQLSKNYHEGSSSHQVLDSVNLKVPQGEFLVLLGASGSGKSTLLNLLSGIDKADSGAIWINGKNLPELDENQRTLFRREHIGFIFQFFNLLPTLSALENVSLPLELAGIQQQLAEAKASELLESVGLADRGESLPDQLSGGEQQRVAIARALVHDPLLVLADEPTGNLDEETGVQVMDLLESLTRSRGKNLIMATHSLENAKRADRVFQLSDGQLAMHKLHETSSR